MSGYALKSKNVLNWFSQILGLENERVLDLVVFQAEVKGFEWDHIYFSIKPPKSFSNYP